MLQPGQNLDFTEEPFRLLGISVAVGEQALHGVNPVGDEVAHLEDLAHAAVSQQGDDLVVAYRFADFKVGCGQRNTSNSGALYGGTLIFRLSPARAWGSAGRLLPGGGGSGGQFAQHAEKSCGGLLVGKSVQGDGGGNVRRFGTEPHADQVMSAGRHQGVYDG